MTLQKITKLTSIHKSLYCKYKHTVNLSMLSLHLTQYIASHSDAKILGYLLIYFLQQIDEFGNVNAILACLNIT